jgi:hypothetical protein
MSQIKNINKILENTFTNTAFSINIATNHFARFHTITLQSSDADTTLS